MGVGTRRTVEHDRRGRADGADIPRLLLQLPNGALLGRLARVHEASRDLDRDALHGRAELLLEDDLGACVWLVSRSEARQDGRSHSEGWWRWWGIKIPVDFSRIATMPTPSISLPAGRVVRSADSHVRGLSLGSW